MISQEFETTRIDAIRQFVRKVLRNARDKNKWRKVVKFRLWMPIVLQLALIAALLSYTNSRFDGFLNETNIYNILVLAMPLAIAAIAQTHSILVGYLDLSVGAMISFGVVAASVLIPRDASGSDIAIGGAAILGAGLVLGLVNAGLIRGVKIPSIVATLARRTAADVVRPAARAS